MEKMNNYKQVMLISPDTIRMMGDVGNNLSEEVIGASIRAVQNVYLIDILGVELVEKLQELVYNKIKGLEDNIDDVQNAHFKTLLSGYIINVMGYKVTGELCLRTALKIRNAGIVQTNDGNLQNASLKDVKFLMQTYDTYFNSSVNRMVEYLREHKDLFPQLKCKNINNKYGNIGIWLGD